MSKIVELYVRRVRNGKMALEEVPEFWRDEVAAKLAEEGSA